MGTDRGVVLWDLARGTELAFLPIGMAWHSMFDVSGDLLTNGSAGVLRWPIHVDPTSGETRIGPPRVCPCRERIAGSPRTERARSSRWPDNSEAHVALGDRTIRIGPLDDCRGVSVSPDGQWLATGSHANGGVTIWRLPDGARATKLPIDGGTGVHFSPDGKWLMTRQASSRLWEVGTWREVRQIEGCFRCFSADGRLGVVQDTSKVLELVEIETGRTLARLESPDQHDVGMAAFSPDGSRLVVTTHEPPCVHVWDLRAIRRHLPRWASTGMRRPFPIAEPSTTGAKDQGPLKLSVDFGPLKKYWKQYQSHLEQNTAPPEELVTRYTERLRAHPEDPESLHQRGHALLRLQRFDQALADFSAALALARSTPICGLTREFAFSIWGGTRWAWINSRRRFRPIRNRCVPSSTWTGF